MKLSDFRLEIKKSLEPVSKEEADFEADCILADLLGCSNSTLRLHFSDEIDETIIEKAMQAVAKRLENEPLQYILGKWEFYSMEFYVGQGVLIPRPETELLVDIAVSFLKEKKNPVCYDLCSGSGCIGISVAKELPDTTVYMLEKSDAAFEYLKKNVVLNSAVGCVPKLGDLFGGAVFEKAADMIISNPPYIKSSVIGELQAEVQKEPHMALDGGEDGLAFYRAIAAGWLGTLKKGGMLAVEIGEEQSEDVKKIFEPYFKEVKAVKDYYGNDRVVACTEKL